MLYSSLHGWLVIDKPYGVSSSAVVTHIKKYIKRSLCAPEVKHFFKIGHGGTLDPLATGILPIALGEATKTVSYIMDAFKEYVFDVTWGESRSTDDQEGEVVETLSYFPSPQEIHSILSAFQGEIWQTPPLYSALKIKGKRSCDRVRRGEIITLPPRKIFIEQIRVIECQKKKATFWVRCGKGTYIRSLARDMAKSLGTRGYVSALKRTKVGQFNLSCAISLDNLERLGHKVEEKLFSLNAVLDDIPAVSVSHDQAKALKQGQTLVFLDNAQSLLKRGFNLS